ncbi:Uncharacterized protein Adt_30462 [Abeliophyllum distichum]|uniref:Uncharacterized protein n=1 Tax=Abeliophyllum distichum TaxID=126358 RepID=A0ABD1RBB1_9LAMI
MDLHPTPFPGKAQASKVKSSKQLSEATKTNTKGPPVLRQKRVFGTARNPNITSKPVPEKTTTKHSYVVPQKAAKPFRKTQSPIDVQAIPETVTQKKSAEENRTRPKKKSVCFQEKEIDKNENKLAKGDLLEPHTPVRSHSVVKPRLSGTPYHSAERCSKCRFDRLETSSYWLGQIKLAESVGKHFVSAAFFRLALESKAEPSRNLRVELKKYLARHEYLSEDEEWRNLSVNYGLLKEESNVGEENGKACANEESASVQDEEDKDLQKENGHECEIVGN